MPAYASASTSKSGAGPSSRRATTIAAAEAPSAAIAIRVSNRRTSSSSTKTAPAIGALKAVASPAPAPAASSTLQSGQLRPAILAMIWAIVAPICTLGPSRPSASPEPIASSPPKNLTGIRRGGAGGTSPSSTASTWGMPLPEAGGEKRRTSQAATAAVTAHVAATNSKPMSFSPCAQVISASRKRSASSSASRKMAPSSPAAPPVRGANSASTRRLPCPFSGRASGFDSGSTEGPNLIERDYALDEVQPRYQPRRNDRLYEG